MRYLPEVSCQASREGRRAVRFFAISSPLFAFLASAAFSSCAPLPSLRDDRSRLEPGARELPLVRFDGHVFQRRQLGNGLHAVAARDEDGGVSVFVVVAAGKRQETARTTGLAHLTEHAMYTGTAMTGAGEHDQRVAEMGGKSNAFTREDYTLFYDHGVPVDDLGEVLAMEADRLRNLSFDPDAIYEERARLRSEESATWQPSQYVTERLEAAVFRRHSYGAGVIDEAGRTLASALGIWDIREFYDRNYHPASVAVVVAGNVEPEAALDAIEAAFGPLPPGPPRAAPPEEPDVVEPRSVILPSNLARDRLEWVWIVPAMGHGDRPALFVLGRLVSRRETSSGAPLFVAMGDRVDKDLYRVAVVGPNAASDLEGLLDDLLAGRIDPAEFEEVKRLEAGRREGQPLRARPYFALATTFGVYEVLGHTEELVQHRSAVERLTLEELLRVARTWLDPQRRIEVRFLGTGADGEPLPDDPAGLHRVADAARQAGDLDRAAEAYTKLLSLDTSKMSEVIALASRGKVRMQQRDYRAAIRDFERALEVIEYPEVRDLLDEARALDAGERSTDGR